MPGEMLQATITEHPDGITAVDTDYIRPGLAAAHVIEQAGRAAFVDVGTNHSVPRLLAALDKLGVEWEPTESERAYNERRSTQVPVNPVVRVKGRFRRHLRYGDSELVLER